MPQGGGGGGGGGKSGGGFITPVDIHKETEIHFKVPTHQIIVFYHIRHSLSYKSFNT